MHDLQIQSLRAILVRVERQPGAVVEIDLDLSALMPIIRTRRALAKAAAETGVSEFANSDALPVLPGYSPEAWTAFLDLTGLPARYPALEWYDVQGKPVRSEGTPFGCFHSSYWTTDWLIEDEPTPGLCSWVNEIEVRGGRVVFLSGRWLPEHVEPTRECLRRSGIPDPSLAIGNDRHETLVGHDAALSDAAAKALRQPEIRRRFGEPIAFIDDRPSNRAAVFEAAGSSIIVAAITIPGFTYDADNEAAPSRISTFELFGEFQSDPPAHPLLLTRYGDRRADRPWHGLYEGLGINNRGYVVRRSSLADHDWRQRLGVTKPPFDCILKENHDSVLPEREFILLCEQTIPPEVSRAVARVINEASRLSDGGLAAPFPDSAAEEESLRRALLASWLHSRDIETLMRSLGFPLQATGVHDINEFAPADQIKTRILRGGRQKYSPWLLAWAETLTAGTEVNVGCFNGALATGMWRWRPGSEGQDAMDVHRLASHHEGDGQERYDPIEAAVNNLLHRREGVSGIRKEPLERWTQLCESMLSPSRASALGKTGLAVGLYRDLAELAPKLEREGFLTPWCLVEQRPLEEDP